MNEVSWDAHVVVGDESSLGWILLCNLIHPNNPIVVIEGVSHYVGLVSGFSGMLGLSDPWWMMAVLVVGSG